MSMRPPGIFACVLTFSAPKSVSVAMLVGRVQGAMGHRVEAISAYSRAIELSDTPRALPMLTAFENVELPQAEAGRSPVTLKRSRRIVVNRRSRCR